DKGHTITPETFTRFIREIVTQRLQHEPLRDYPDLAFGENRPLPPHAFGLPDDEMRDYTDPAFDTLLSQGMAEEYYGMLSGYGTPWTLEDFRHFRDEVSREAEREMDEEDGEKTSSDG
ncbi:MAG: hypothetical protein M3176_14800, partial [Chloroflexota bacterium]|nr:hypothetical protein [Chloroflexota bacterium]